MEDRWLTSQSSACQTVKTTPNHAGDTSGDPSSALACGTCHTVPSCELHIRKLGDISTLPILSLIVLQSRGQGVLTLILASLLGEVGKRLPHSHTWKTQEQSVILTVCWLSVHTVPVKGLVHSSIQ